MVEAAEDAGGEEYEKNNEPNGFLGAGDNDWFFIELAFEEPCDDCWEAC